MEVWQWRRTIFLWDWTITFTFVCIKFWECNSTILLGNLANTRASSFIEKWFVCCAIFLWLIAYALTNFAIKNWKACRFTAVSLRNIALTWTCSFFESWIWLSTISLSHNTFTIAKIGVEKRKCLVTSIFGCHAYARAGMCIKDWEFWCTIRLGQ